MGVCARVCVGRVLVRQRGPSKASLGTTALLYTRKMSEVKTFGKQLDLSFLPGKVSISVLSSSAECSLEELEELSS